MPRAFLITHRRYNGAEEFGESRDFSPEHDIRIPDCHSNQPTSDGVSDCGSETSSECPEELYNLTKLAEVSLAAAAGTLIHPSNVIYHSSVSSRWTPAVENVHKFHAAPAEPQINKRPIEEDADLGLREKTRLFFERIESEKKILEDKSRLTLPNNNEQDTRKSSPSVQPRLPLNFGRRNSGGHSDSSKTDDNEDHECPDCGKKYSTSSNLARHRQTHRSLGDKKARRCPHCDKVYVSMPAFSMHVRTHNQGCKCHYCGKCFSRPWLLQGHIRTHTGEKPFKCTICNKAFADKSNLRAHVQTHSNTKPHICGRCGKAFALKSYLYKHEESSCMRAHHRVVGDRKENTDIAINTMPPSSASPSSSPPSSLSSPPRSPPRNLSAITSSPTSVIVSRPGFKETSPASSSTPAANLTSIIRHTKSSQLSSSPIHPQDYRLDPAERSQDHFTKVKEFEEDGADEYSSRMVIRTSVISPNPEHIPGRHLMTKSGPFDYTDPSRLSAFSRPTGITLNFAIA